MTPSPVADSRDASSAVATTRVLGEVTALMIQRYAIAVGDTNRLYFDNEYARACGYPGIIAPPNFLPAILGWEAGPTEQELLEDGNDPSLVLPELRGCRLMGGGQQLTFGQPVRPGDIVTAERRLVDFYEKQAKAGRLIFAVSEIRYTNQHGEHLLDCRETLIAAR